MKRFLLGFFALTMTFNASATVVTGTDGNNTNTDISFGNQASSFNISGTLSLLGNNAQVQLNQSQASEFGLYKDNQLFRDVSFFTSSGNGYTFLFNALPTGNYFLRFNITSNNRDYTLTYNLNPITAVPEPITSSMLLSGLIGIGLIAYRKRPR